MENFFFFIGGAGTDSREASRDVGEEREVGAESALSREELSPAGLFNLY